MSHFAQVIDGIVQQVIVAEQDFIDTLPDKQNWIQTSYNTLGGKHLLNGTPLRGNYAAIGFTYDSTNDVFYSPKPKDSFGKICESWTISAPNWQWTPPIPMPTEPVLEYPNHFTWDESTKSWVQV